MVIVRRSHSPYGGAETSIDQLCKALSEWGGLDLSILTQSWTPCFDRQRVTLAKHTVKDTGFTRAGRFKNFSRQVREVLGANHFDISQTHERIPGCDVFRAGDGVHASWLHRIAMLRRFPTALLRLDPYHRCQLIAERLIALGDESIIVANSQLVQYEFISILGVNPDRVRLIPNMISDVLDRIPSETDKRISKRALGLNQDDPVVLFVGSGFERKGAFELVRSASHCAKLQVLIIGKDRRPEQLQRVIEELDLTTRVRLIGPQRDLRGFWAAADVFCLPSLYDSFPNAALEALAHGIPCILSEGVGITDEWVSERVAVKSARDPHALADCIHSVLRDLSHFRANTLKKARAYLPEKVAPMWISLYREVLRGKR